MPNEIDNKGQPSVSIEAITRFLFMRDQPGPVDLALVLGAPSLSNVLPAIALFHAGLTPRLLISGHGPIAEGEPEWRAYRDHAIGAGVPASRILIEPDARNTLENFVFSRALIERETGWARIARLAICCKPVHTRRAYMTARAQLPGAVALRMMAPEDHGDIRAGTWWRSARGRTRVLGELGRIAAYAEKGDLSLE